MIIDLKDRNVLFISSKFFGYEKNIKSELEKLGAVVDYFDDRPSNDFITKVFIRLKLKFILNKKIKIYYEKIFNEIKDKHYDYIFVISPETFSYKEFEIIKQLHPKARSFLYMWDSFTNKNSFNTLKLFDKVFSFDSKDVKKHNLIFLPLFYIKQYEELEFKNYEYDLTFIATAHSDRYKIAKKISNLLLDERTYFYFYLPSKIIYYIRRYFMKNYNYDNIENFRFKSLEHNKIVEIFSKSKVILDINHPNQCGLTMRTFECLGAKKKLITTNKNIIEYDFYNKNNILIIDRKHIKIDKRFFDVPYERIEKSIYQKYSIENWLKIIFSS